MSSEIFICSSCQIPIIDEYYFHVGKQIYHSTCLQCSICQTLLTNHSTCFFKNENLICSKDFFQISFSTRQCTKCKRSLNSNDWIRRACQYIYHLTCFTCYQCGRQLSTGEEYGLKKSEIVCKRHLIENENENQREHEKRIRRIRTIFTDEQLEYLQNQFDLNPNPDEQELQIMASIIGLNKRVVQVWFQNSRARQKKIHLENFKQIKMKTNRML